MSNPTIDHHDEPYTWGRRPDTYLAPREIVRLTIFRSRLRSRVELRNRAFANRRRQSEASA
jgi:hypothetical protein